METSTYGSELVAGRIATEMAIDYRYRLRMLGVPILGSCLMFGDNQSMVTSVSVPGSSLKKRHSALAYHRIREAIASGICDIVHCRSEYNLADLMTKPLGPQVFSRLTHNIRFPPTSTDAGELNGIENDETDKTVRSHIVIVHPLNDRDIVDAFGSQVFVNGLIKLKSREELDG